MGPNLMTLQQGKNSLEYESKLESVIFCRRTLKNASL